MNDRTIFLVGPMGAGKSTIGRRLAEHLQRPFYDTDLLIQERTGADIPLIFEIEGEAGFRQRESAVLQELAGLEGAVVATGGGVVTIRENREWLRARGFVIYLRATVAEQLRRTRKDQKRPLLQGGDRRTILEGLMRQRDPLYHEVADLVVSTDGARPVQLARRLARQVTGETPA